MRLVRTMLLGGALLLFPAFSDAANSAAALYNRGNELYKAGGYQAAKEAYKKALTTGTPNAQLYYNLGNAQLRTGKLGSAIASYLRAKRLRPRDPDIIFNLEYARTKIKARLIEPPRGPAGRALDMALDSLNANEWTAVVLGAYWLSAMCIVVIILGKTDRIRRASRFIIYVGIMVLVVAAPFASIRVKRDLVTPRVVIMLDKVTVRSGPGEDNKEQFDLYEGMDMVVGQCESGWCNVSAPGGFNGWAPAESFEWL